MSDEKNIETIIERVKSESFSIDHFRKGTVEFFIGENPDLIQPQRVVHSVKSRMKDIDRLREKIQRKSLEDPITSENIFDRITDIAGVRVLHLYQAQFPQIHKAITKKVVEKEWAFPEDPKAYTWDPESKKFFQNQGLKVELKESLYTSIHYVIKPRLDSHVSCEIQVRTLFEEIWGEIDHLINYPEPTDSVACREQIGVLARLVGAGSRLADSIWRTYSDEKEADEHSESSASQGK